MKSKRKRYTWLIIQILSVLVILEYAVREVSVKMAYVRIEEVDESKKDSVESLVKGCAGAARY